MPDPKTCAKRFKPGTQAYDDCVGYKGKSRAKKKPANEMSRVRGGY
tara:strand:- start:235 stop:372 length:138 start_codon:yes stop_codon:yes gene_type:complete